MSRIGDQPSLPKHTPVHHAQETGKAEKGRGSPESMKATAEKVKGLEVPVVKHRFEPGVPEPATTERMLRAFRLSVHAKQ